MKKLILVILAVASVGAQQPPGQIRPRPAQGREPQLTPPTIREIQPKSSSSSRSIRCRARSFR